MPKPRSSNDNLLSPLFDQQKIRQSENVARKHLFSKNQFQGVNSTVLTLQNDNNLLRSQWPIGGYAFITSDGLATHTIQTVRDVFLNGVEETNIQLPAIANFLLLLMREAPNRWLLSGSIPGGGGGRTLIEETFTNTGQDTVLFQNIPATFTKLELEINGGITGLTTAASIFLRVGIGGVIQSGNQYRGGGFAFNFSTGTSSLQTQTSFIQEATIPQVLAPNNNPQFGYNTITLPNYASEDDDIFFHARIGNIPPTLLAMFEGQYSWSFQNLDNDIIDTLQITIPSPEDFQQGSLFRLYGS